MQSEIVKLDPWTKSFYVVEKDFLKLYFPFPSLKELHDVGIFQFNKHVNVRNFSYPYRQENIFYMYKDITRENLRRFKEYFIEQYFEDFRHKPEKELPTCSGGNYVDVFGDYDLSLTFRDIIENYKLTSIYVYLKQEYPQTFKNILTNTKSLSEISDSINFLHDSTHSVSEVEINGHEYICMHFFLGFGASWLIKYQKIDSPDGVDGFYGLTILDSVFFQSRAHTSRAHIHDTSLISEIFNRSLISEIFMNRPDVDISSLKKLK